jgi:hypothetical protein
MFRSINLPEYRAEVQPFVIQLQLALQLIGGGSAAIQAVNN